jgi:MFS family permease
VSADQNPVPVRPAALAVLAAVFLDLVGFGIVVPQLPLAADRFTTSGLVVGLVVAVDSLMSFLLAPRWGRLSDRVGRRPVLLLGLYGSAIAYLVFGLAGSLVALVASRVLSGSLGATVNVAQAALADLTRPDQRARAMGLVGAAFGLAFTVGPMLGGIASRWGEGAPGLLAASICAVNAVLATFTLKDSRMRTEQAWGQTTRVPRPAFAAIFLATFSFTTMYVVFQRFSAAQLGLGRAAISYLFVLVGLVSVVVQGRLLRRLAPRHGELRLALLGTALLAAGLAGLPLAALVAQPASRLAILVLAVIAVSAGFSFAGPCVTAFVSRKAHPHDQGRVLGTLQSIGASARIVGPPVLGLVGQRGGFTAAFAAAAVAATVAGVVVGRWGRTANSQGETTETREVRSNQPNVSAAPEPAPVPAADLAN